jgi:hypothetical protein
MMMMMIVAITATAAAATAAVVVVVGMASVCGLVEYTNVLIRIEIDHRRRHGPVWY